MKIVRRQKARRADVLSRDMIIAADVRGKLDVARAEIERLEGTAQDLRQVIERERQASEAARRSYEAKIDQLRDQLARGRRALQALALQALQDPELAGTLVTALARIARFPEESST